MSAFAVRAFVRMRAALTDTRELARKLAQLERELKGRLDVHGSAIVNLLERVLSILSPPRLPAPKRRRSIGFRVQEARPADRRRRSVTLRIVPWKSGNARIVRRAEFLMVSPELGRHVPVAVPVGDRLSVRTGCAGGVAMRQGTAKARHKFMAVL